MKQLIVPIFILLGLITSNAFADIYNRQILPLGEGEAFMANTGTGGCADTGAVYYNPAGLIGIIHSRMAVTGSTYLSFGIKADSIARVDTPPQNISYEAKGFNTIPASYVLTYILDQAVIAFSVLIPDSLQFDNRSNFKTTNTQGVIIESYRTSDLWVGGSFAKRIDEKWSVGGTLFGIQHSETSLTEAMIDIPTSANSLVSSISRSDFSVFGFSLNLGVLYKFSDVVSFGLRLQTPLVSVSNHANTLVNGRTVATGVVTASDEDHPIGTAQYQLPLDTTLGARFHPTESWNIYSDISFQAGTQYTELPGSSITSDVNTDPTFRYSVGTEFKITDKIPVRFGLFYNPSALHQFKNNGQSQTKINYFGITSGLSYIVEHVETGLGFFYISGSGQSTTDGAPGNAANYTASGFGALLSTAYYF